MKTIKKYQKALNEMIEEIKENRKYPLLVFYITQEDYEKIIRSIYSSIPSMEKVYAGFPYQ